FDLATSKGRQTLSQAWGGPLVFAEQVHSDRLSWIDETGDGPATIWPGGGCDALATGLAGVALVARGADCVPVLLADPEARLVAAVHAGWRGLLAGVVPAAVQELRGRGARHLRAAIGPAICGECYEVGPGLAAKAQADGHIVLDGGSARRGAGGQDGDANGPPKAAPDHLDVAASVRLQLERRGVAVAADLRQCTAESDHLFSWRARRDQGRQGGLVALV
ncbi:MAG: polyphenol oxidase family protein, partial [Bifidobacteriaceae bacterium]|nr:polyphenol oxidase family protein [Bifidobacteriaceae bacterium]